jgi:hypothetical protein
MRHTYPLSERTDQKTQVATTVTCQSGELSNAVFARTSQLSASTA